MKIVIVGLGTQGLKRLKIAGKKVVATVDPYNQQANFKKIKDIPINTYDAVFICTPDNAKYSIINFCIKNKKHILVEKPLNLNQVRFKRIIKEIKQQKIILYVAYNHRFEPNLIKVKKYLDKKKIGKIYYCKIFYGNGTARLVKKSDWRDKGNGVLSDLGSHLIDLLFYWFDDYKFNFKKIGFFNYENKSSDNASIFSTNRKINVFLDMSLTSWKNEFTCEIVGSKGSLHVYNLCKWTDSIFYFRKRVLPSGVPKEKKIIEKKGDPTWLEEQKYFFNLIKNKKNLNLNYQIYNYNIIHNLK